MLELILWVLAAVAALLALFLAYLAWLARPGRPVRALVPGDPDPAMSPVQAEDRLARMTALDTDEYNAPCATRLVEPPGGVDARGTIVFYHGFTNCPAQFAAAADAIAARGWRVFLPRAPLHGQKNVLNHDLKDLTVEQLVRHVDMSIDVVAGFEGPLYVTGLSGGGVLAAWAGATRAEVTGFLAVAPIAAPAGMPLFVARGFVAAPWLVPHLYWWWDPRKKANLGESPYVYPGFPMPGLEPYLHMAAFLETACPAVPGWLESADLMLNPGDFGVRRDAARTMMRPFDAGGRRTEEVVLAKQLGWWHDFVDPRGRHAGTPGQVADIFLAALGQGDDPSAGGLIAYREPLADSIERGAGLDDARLERSAADAARAETDRKAETGPAAGGA
jgi:Serine aminopeptidase, S33